MKIVREILVVTLILSIALVCNAQNERGVSTSGISASSASDTLAAPKVTDIKPIPQMEFERDQFGQLYQYPAVAPFLRDINTSGSLMDWHHFHFTAEGRFSEKPFLLVSHGAAFGVSGAYGPLTYSANVSAQNYAYMPAGSLYQFGVGGVVNYRVSDAVSLTAFAQLYNVNPNLGWAASPYVSTSRFGGFATFENDRVGVDVGVQRYFDPMRGGWITAPIVTPKVKLWDSVTISVPVGGAIRNAYDRYTRPQGPPPPPAGPKKK